MRLKLFLPVILCLTVFNHAMGATSVCCDQKVIDGQPCQCYSDATGSCAGCSSASGSGCTNCTGTDWTPASTTGYESRKKAICMTGSCSQLLEFRCSAGYYGESTNGTSGCTRCPRLLGKSFWVYGISPAGAAAITQCYFPKGTTNDTGPLDQSGTYVFTADCYYNGGL